MKPTGVIGSLGLSLLALIALWGVVSSSAAGQPDRLATFPADPLAPVALPENFATDFVYDLQVQANRVFWSLGSGCPGGEFPVGCAVRSKAASSTYFPSTVFTTTAGPYLESNLAVDGSYLYWINNSGQIVRLPRDAWSAATPTVIAAKEFVTTSGEIAVDATYVYWTENRTSPNLGKVFRAPKSGGSRTLMQQYNAGLGNLQADGTGAVFYISSVFFNDTLIRTRPVSGSVFTSTAASALVQQYTLDASKVYWADALSGVKIKSAVVSNTVSATTMYTLDSTGSPEVRSMAVDAANLYWHEFRAPNGPVRRLPLAGGSPVALTVPLNEAHDLRSSGVFLFWYDNQNIWRLPADVSALELDLSVADIEVTQGIQNLTNTVPLVQDKLTYVRISPALANSSAPTKTALIRLYGTRNGVPLAGSPLAAQWVTAKTAGAQRETYSDTVNIYLPANWLNGTVTLRAQVSVYDLFDTAPANNNKTITVTFTPKSNICLKFLPMLTTTHPPYYTRNLVTGRPTPGFTPILQRFGTLWPAARILWYSQTPALRKPCFLCPAGPFNMVGAADKDWVLFALWEHNIWDSAPAWCGGANARTVYVAMLHPGIDSGSLGGYASLVEPTTMVKMLAGGATPFDTPDGGTIMAQEVAHTHNGLFGDRFKHVNCGLPPGDDPHDGYPYPPGQIGPIGSRNYYGFDWVTRSVIPPDQAKDYMSYCWPKWVSDYNWRGIFDLTGSPVRQVPARPAAELITASGLVDHGETSAAFTIVYRASSDMLKPATPVLADHLHAAPSGEFALELISASNTVLAAQIVTPTTGTHGQHDQLDYMFFGALPFDASAAALRLTRNGVELTRRSISANSPIVTITQPATGTVAGDSLTVTWSASDADGDPLTYLVQYSPDNVNWQVFATGLTGNSIVLTDTSDLGGSNKAYVRVVASDGVNTGLATSPLFALGNHKPNVYIVAPAEGEAFLVQQPVILQGQSLDPEQGPLGEPFLQWQITGPVTRTAAGSAVTFYDLAPGAYTVRFTGIDGAGLSITITSTFFISPKHVYDSSAPVLDGYCNDAAYTADLEPLHLRYTFGDVAQVRLAHAGGFTYACFTGLPIGSDPDERAGLKFDLDNSGGGALQVGDRVFYTRRDGVALTGNGNGSGETWDALPQGLTVAVSDDGSYWSAELRIDDARLSGWDRLIKLQAGHYWRTGFNSDTTWPNPSSYFVPDSWGLATLGRLAQTISFAALPDRVVNELPFTLSAASSAGLPVAFASSTPAVCTASGSIVTLLSIGTCTIVASQPGNGSYTAAPNVVRSFAVTPSANGGRIYLPAILR